MKTWIIRPATNADAEDAVAVLRASIIELGFADHQNDPATLARWLRNKHPEQFRGWLSNPDSCMVVAEADGEIGGVGGIRRCGQLDFCYVRPGCERQGIGRALMAALESQARGWGLGQVELISTVVARPFYERLGYEFTGENARAQNGLLLDFRYVKRLG